MEMTVSLPGGARVDATYKDFVIRTDQPARHGGDDTAPAPFDYFLASIGTCAGYYAQRFLEQRGLATDGVVLTLETVKDSRTHMIDNIKIRIRLPESFPRKYQRAIVHAVDLCTVKRHLETPPSFETIVEIEPTPAIAVATGPQHREEKS